MTDAQETCSSPTNLAKRYFSVSSTEKILRNTTRVNRQEHREEQWKEKGFGNIPSFKSQLFTLVCDCEQVVSTSLSPDFLICKVVV